MKWILFLSYLLLSTFSSGQTADRSTKPSIDDTFHYFTILDTNYKLYVLPLNFEKPKTWKDLEVESGYGALCCRNWKQEYPKGFNLSKALNYIDTAKQYSNVMLAYGWCIQNYQEAFPYLVARLCVKQKVGLENTADLIIGERISTGELKFYGHGGVISEDIFTIAGRASWILNDLTGEDFAIVHGTMTESQALKFKKLWINYINSNLCK